MMEKSACARTYYIVFRTVNVFVGRLSSEYEKLLQRVFRESKVWKQVGGVGRFVIQDFWEVSRTSVITSK
jgi:uncharacterized protein (UPF0128 family)